MAAALRKETPPSTRNFEPKLTLPDRRHSSAHPVIPADPRRGSTTSTTSRKDSTSETPAWLTAMNERNNSVSSAPDTERRRSSLGGLFHRKNSESEGGSKAKKPEAKMVITSKHSGQVKNKLKADPRGARKEASGTKTAGVEGTQNTLHLTAKQQEERHPHSGPPALHSEIGPALARIESVDVESSDDEETKGMRRLDVGGGRREGWLKSQSSLEKVQEVGLGEGDERERDRHHSEDIGVGHIVEEVPVRRKSLLEVEIKGGVGQRPRGRKNVFGGWTRDETGVWHRMR